MGYLGGGLVLCESIRVVERIVYRTVSAVVPEILWVMIFGQQRAYGYVVEGYIPIAASSAIAGSGG